MLSVTSLRAGTTFAENKDIFEVLSYEHIKMGRGSASVKIKVRNLRSGAILGKSFISHAEVDEIHLDKKELQYLYRDLDPPAGEAGYAYFMDPSTFEQMQIPLRQLSGYEFLKEGEMTQARFYQDEPLGLILAPKVTLKVVDTPPGVRGDSASNVYKDAIVENGMRVKIPLFINVGESIVVDTRDGSYTKRA